MKHGYEGAVAGDAPERFRGNTTAVIQGGAQGAVGGQGVLLEVHDDLGAIGGGTSGIPVGQVALRDLDQGVGGGDQAASSGFRGNSGGGGGADGLFLLARASSFVDGPGYDGRLVGMEDHAQADHPVLEVLLLEIPEVVQAVAVLGEVLHPAELAAQALELGAGAETGHLEEGALVFGGGDPGEGPDLGVRENALAEGGVDLRQGSEGAGDPDLLAGGVRVEADPPGQPVGAAERALAVPFAGFVEHPDAGEQAVGGGVQVGGGAGDLVCQALGVGGNRRGFRG